MQKVFIHSIKTKIGVIRSAATERGLAVISLPNQNEKSFRVQVSKVFPQHEHMSGGELNVRFEEQLRSYLEGRLRNFHLKLDVHGTPFQKLVLQEVASIPYGKTMTYGQIAEMIGHQGASRAVGNANATNCLPLVIPCHRVIAATGFGGYGGGMELKMKLLHLEGAI